MKKILLLLITIFTPFVLYAQDDCNNAITIIPSVIDTENAFSLNDEELNFTLSDHPDDCIDTTDFPDLPMRDIWVTFEATSDRLWVYYAPFWTLYHGACDNLEEVDCSQGPLGDLMIELIEGDTYFMRLYVDSQYSGFNVVLTPDPGGITVSTDEYDALGLITDVLADNSCGGTFSNATTISGIDFSTINSIGSFIKNDDAYFPFDKGVILTTGMVTEVSISGAAWGGGPALSATWPSWVGDEDIQQLYSGTTTNATSLEFDFTALAGSVSFEYFFASEQYTYCNNVDLFAIFLTDLESGETTNIALVPGTDLPISTENISSNTLGAGCENMYSQYFTSNQFMGFAYQYKTVLLTATGTIIPNHNYHVKIVIADGTNGMFDSAVFLKSMSFGFDVPDEDIISDNNYGIVCSNSPTILTANVSDEFNFQWSLNGVEIEAATGATYSATEAGTYSVHIVYPEMGATCGGVFEHTLTGVDVNPEVNDITIEDDNNDGVAQFDLNAITEQIFQENGFNEFLEPGFYLTVAQAEEALSEDNLNYFGPYTNVSNPQTLYLRIGGIDNDCFSVTPVQFTVQVDETPAPTGDALQVFMEGATIADLAVTGNNIQWYSDAEGENQLLPTTVLEDDTMYYASQTIGGLESVIMLAVTVNIIVPTPAPTGETIQYFLENSTLSELVAVGENIQWYAIAQGGEALPVSTLLVNNMMYYASQTIDGLESEQRLSVTAFVTSPPPTGEPEQTLSEGATLADIDMEGEDIQWYDTPGAIVPEPPNNNDTPLPLTTVLVDGETYYASQTIDGLESAFRTAVTITLAPAPTVEAPTGLTEQSFTEGETLANLDVIGENIKWYATTDSDEMLSMATILIDNTTYYATQTVNNIESTERLGVTVNLVLGTDEFAFNGFHYSPNPVEGLLTIVNGQDITHIAVFDILGQQIIAAEMNAPAILADFSRFETGIYLVKVQSGSNTKSFKVVKK